MATAFKKFTDRTAAGKALAEALAAYRGKTDTLLLALPRGGVPVAREIADALGLPMDIWLVRKLGVPGHEELAFGAIAGNDVMVRNEEIIFHYKLDSAAIEAVTAAERAEIARRNELYRDGRPAPDVAAKTVIVVDDGLATGATMRAAIASLRAAHAGKIIAAAPVGALASCEEIRKDADDVICLATPEPFYGVGQWYEAFPEVTDDEVCECLAADAAGLRNKNTGQGISG
jgi:predicted phosphoribosyltransferase